MNNMVTTDSDNLTEGCQFLQPLIYIPLSCIVSMVFLYRVLGWRSVIHT